MENIAIPVDVTAFVLNKKSCDGIPRIGPITQPDYIGLRLDESLIQHDVLDQIDFHLTAPATVNPRLTDLGTNPPQFRQNRLGVYLHWSLPRLYRAATQYADSTQQATDNAKKSATDPTNTADPSQPTYPAVPNRWLVVRKLTNPQPAGKLPDFQTWVVESNRLQHIQDIPDNVDLEVDVTPFVEYQKDSTSGVLATQAEIFLGKRNEHSGWQDQTTGWSEDTAPAAGKFLNGLTIMDSSNPLFPDYVPHNGSVFSLVDSFSYQENNTVQHLTSATADYFVVGWHSDPTLAPLSTGGDTTPVLSDRLSKLFLTTNPPSVSDADLAQHPEWKNIQAALNSKNATNVLIYGAVYNVKYDVNIRPHCIADDAAQKFQTTTPMEPLSIGTTPLDAVLSFLKAHQQDIETFFPTSGLPPDPNDPTFDPNFTNKNLTDLILELASLLYIADDSYDSRVRAQDLLYANNWGSSQGGFQWKFDGKADPGKPPSAPLVDKTKGIDQVTPLATLNELQAQLDAKTNKLQAKRWDLFASWWKFVSDFTNYQGDREAAYKTDVQNLINTDIKPLIADITNLSQTIGKMSGTYPPDTPPPPVVPCKKVPLPTFFTKKDPTLCIANLDPGWPTDFLQTLTAKLDSQLLDPTDANNATKIPDFGNLFHNLSNPVPTTGGLRQTANKILAECLSRSGSTKSTDYTKGYKDWGNANPFAPMFIEWEALYYHIERDYWDVAEQTNPFGAAHQQVRFGIKPNEILYKDDSMKTIDRRPISGRVLILPQPVFSLSNIVKSVLDNSPDVPKDVSDKKREILDTVGRLKFISAPLDGLTQHLLTRYTGTHVTPLVRQQGQQVTVLEDAVSWKQDPLGLGDAGIKLIDSESTTTPYGNLLEFNPKTYPKAPFKGMTHGQMIITKLNIIDKFGQAICLPSIKQQIPNPNSQNTDTTKPPDAVYPCISDYLTPDLDVNGNLNTIYPEPNTTGEKWPICRFIQLTPSINQPARINASFLNQNNSSSYPFWHETVDDIPESPIIGWIVINYQDSGLQFFLSDGTFYREVRIGGPTGANAGSKWLPFDGPPTKPSGNMQLDGLISQLVGDATYLQAFFDAINGAIVTMPYAPSDYSAYANSLVGKPLALVNVGWSLEISTPALIHQNTLGNIPADEAKELASYQFPLKIGDWQRSFDGVVGYFDSDNTLNGNTNWTQLFTYFPSSATASDQKNKSTGIEPNNFPLLNPRYIDPADANFATKGDPSGIKYKTYTEARTAQYTIKTLLIDPYTPIHAYSPILPIKSLQLPAWTIQRAFTRMTAFFRLGPNLLSQDVPTPYDTGRPLNPDTWNQVQTVQNAASTAKANPQNPIVNTIPQPPNSNLPVNPTPPGSIPNTSAVTTATPSIRLPISGKKGLWQWLQPYDTPNDSGKNTDPRQTKFNALGIDQEDTKIRKDPAPYTFVEGYLQLARPLLSEDVANM